MIDGFSRLDAPSGICTATLLAVNLKLRPQPIHETLLRARHCQTTREFRQYYAKRAGIEGTISQGVIAFGLRRTRYRSLAKTELQHMAAAVAMNRVRFCA